MSGAGFALQKAVFAALQGDAELVALVGDRIFDAAPRGAEFPYLAFAEATERGFAGDGAPISEHRLALVAWSRHRGRKEALAIAGRVAALLHDQALALDGHVLVNLRHEATETRRADATTWRATLRLRAVTEPA